MIDEGRRPVSRHRQREFALQVLFSGHFSQLGAEEKTLGRTFEHFAAENGWDPEELPLAWLLVQGVDRERERIDQAISRHSQNWKINRIAKLELTILRISMFEMMFLPDIPSRVSINEAVELAKDFGDGNSGVFVNGILDAVARSL
ncbi:MAG: transcription antitermination factor NusB [Deltaproteobacteria bacterium]|nr:transcription antitermination factor NusB [Deltaproteobacteria bacterium]